MAALHAEERRSARLEQRMSPGIKNLIERAAALQGVTASEFVLAHSVIAARETINRLEVTRLEPKDRDAFLHALDDETVNDALVDVLKLRSLVGRKN